MSNLLNAIAQSEQQHQVYTPRPSQQVRPVIASRQLSSWLLPALLMVAPVAGTLAYSQWRLPDVAVVEPAVVLQPNANAPVVEPALVTIEDVVKEKALPLRAGEDSVRLLPYPELRTEPLPSLNHQLASQAEGRVVQPVVIPTDSKSGKEVKEVSAEDNEWSLDELDYSELSPQLAAQLKSAIAATGEPDDAQSEEPGATVLPQPAAEPVVKAIALGELPASVQSRIPSLNFQTHIYSSTADSRWVKVNGREAFEGDEIAPGVTLRRIEPRQVVFDFESYLVSMPALSEW